MHLNELTNLNRHLNNKRQYCIPWNAHTQVLPKIKEFHVNERIREKKSKKGFPRPKRLKPRCMLYFVLVLVIYNFVV